VKIFFDNVNISSSSGPNSFGKRLINEMRRMGHKTCLTPENHDVQLSFITMNQKTGPTALRLDGIYFNTRQDWTSQNRLIQASFKAADLVIYQSSFNKALCEQFFGNPKSSIIINNGTCLETIRNIPRLSSSILDGFSEVWSCASSWRPHKRLRENVRYFLEKAPEDSCLIIAGENPDYSADHPRVFYTGQLSWEDCISLYKRSTTFLHLAFLDHCPNVVVDARASGCKLVVASSGGTKEIAAIGDVIIDDLEWDFKPLDLYSPPTLDFSKSFQKTNEVDIDIQVVATKYIDALQLLT